MTHPATDPATSQPPASAEPTARQPRPPADLRLMGAAAVGWAVLALTLGLDARVRAIVLGCAAVLGLGLGMSVARRRPTARHSRARRAPALLLLSLATVTTLQAALLGHQLLRATGPLPRLTQDRAVVTVTGTVATDPRPVASTRGKPVVLLRVTAESVTGRGQVSPAHGPILIRGDQALLNLRWGAQVSLTGRLSPMESADPEVAALRPTRPPQTTAQPGLIARGAEHLRAGLRQSVAQLPPDARGLVPGLVIGDTSGLPPELDSAMRATGMTHLTAVSGSNVAVVLSLTFALTRLLGVPRRWRPWLALVVLAGFVVLARPEPSVLRAATMGAIGVLGLSRHRHGAGLPILGGAVVVLLVLDPWLSRSYGFALSTLATLGLLVFAGPWGGHLADALRRRIQRSSLGPRLPSRWRERPSTWSTVGSALAVPVAAQVVCAPVLVLLQSSVSLVGVLANLLAAPLVPLTTIGGVAVAALAPIWPTGARWLAWLPGAPALAIGRIGRVLADVPMGSIPWPGGAGGAAALAALTIGLLLVGRSLVALVRRRTLATLAVAALTAATLVPTRPITWPPEGWEMVSCDIGQGDATVLRSGPGHAVVVDAGPEPDLVDSCLDRLGVAVVDAVVLTHFHLDHAGGLEGVSRGRPVGALLTTFVAEPDDIVAGVRSWAQEHHVPTTELHAGDTLRYGTIEASVWWPERRIDAGSVPNNASVVLAVEDDGVRALLLGDVEREAGAALLRRIRRDPVMTAQAAAFDVVKSPHHGSANVDAHLLETVRAPLAIISVGADNDYGHPAPAHLKLLHDLGYAVRRTDLNGDIAVVRSQGHTSVLTQK